MTISGMIFHNLKGSTGWSYLSLSNVNKVLGLNVRKRLFKILDRDKPFTLSLKYDEMKVSSQMMSTVNFDGSMGMTIVPQIEKEQQITKRYKTEQEANDEMKEIIEKQQLLKKYLDQVRSQILSISLKD